MGAIEQGAQRYMFVLLPIDSIFFHIHSAFKTSLQIEIVQHIKQCDISQMSSISENKIWFYNVEPVSTRRYTEVTTLCGLKDFHPVSICDIKRLKRLFDDVIIIRAKKS